MNLDIVGYRANPTEESLVHCSPHRSDLDRSPIHRVVAHAIVEEDGDDHQDDYQCETDGDIVPPQKELEPIKL